MKNTAAIVTLAIGQQYLDSWRHFCEPSWRSYASKHSYDIICIDTPLDKSARAQDRSPSWQKCLVLSQEFSPKYQRIVWVDSDILINTKISPNIVDGVPIDKVGAAEQLTYSHDAGTLPQQLLERVYKYWTNPIINYTARDYYTNWGLPGNHDWVVQAGVLVLSPSHHRALLESVYYNYEDRGGSVWHYEMRPLSYELMNAGIVHWIDPRFNLLWPYWQMMYYPMLLEPKARPDLPARVTRKVAAALRMDFRTRLRRVGVTAAFWNSYFLHMGGGSIKDAALVDTEGRHLWFSPDDERRSLTQ
jgi:hypothetical protein